MASGTPITITLALFIDYRRDHKLVQQGGFGQVDDQLICWFTGQTFSDKSSPAGRCFLSDLLQYLLACGGYTSQLNQTRPINGTILIGFRFHSSKENLSG